MSPAAIVAMAAISVVAWFFLLIFLIGRLGGWRKLAEAAPGGDPPSGPIRKGRSLGIYPVTNYTGVIDMVVGLDGLWAQPMWLFRLGHPPVRFPWTALRTLERGSGLVRGWKLGFEIAGKSVLAVLPLDSESELRNVRLDGVATPW